MLLRPSSPLRNKVEDQLARFERDRAPHLPALDDLDIDINDTLRPVTPVPPSEQNYAVYETAQIFDPLPPEKVDYRKVVASDFSGAVSMGEREAYKRHVGPLILRAQGNIVRRISRYLERTPFELPQALSGTTPNSMSRTELAALRPYWDALDQLLNHPHSYVARRDQLIGVSLNTRDHDTLAEMLRQLMRAGAAQAQDAGFALPPTPKFGRTGIQRNDTPWQKLDALDYHPKYNGPCIAFAWKISCIRFGSV